MRIELILFGPLLLLNGYRAAAELIRWRTARSLDRGMWLNAAAAMVCALILLAAADQRYVNRQAQAFTAALIAQCQQGGAPSPPIAAQATPEERAALQATLSRLPSEDGFQITASSCARGLCFCTARFENGYMLELSLDARRGGPVRWPPFFGAPDFALRHAAYASEEERAAASPTEAAPGAPPQ